jgi:hypothetical protein
MAHYRLCSADAIKGLAVVDAHIRRRMRARKSGSVRRAVEQSIAPTRRLEQRVALGCR